VGTLSLSNSAYENLGKCALLSLVGRCHTFFFFFFFLIIIILWLCTYIIQFPNTYMTYDHHVILIPTMYINL
jgi:hypothetical protein